MWKTSSDESGSEETSPEETSARPVQGRSVIPNSPQRVASLGPSLVIRGTLSGQEDLMIEGQVEGEISLRKHSVTVGQKGRVKADIFSKSICIEGEVQGNLFGEDQVTIRQSGKVRGNVTSPRVTLEDGSKFKGAIDMNPPPALAEKAAPAEQEPAKKRPAHGRQAPREQNSAAAEKRDRERTSKPAEG